MWTASVIVSTWKFCLGFFPCFYKLDWSNDSLLIPHDLFPVLFLFSPGRQGKFEEIFLPNRTWRIRRQPRPSDLLYYAQILLRHNSYSLPSAFLPGRALSFRKRSILIFLLGAIVESSFLSLTRTHICNLVMYSCVIYGDPAVFNKKLHHLILTAPHSILSCRARTKIEF